MDQLRKMWPLLLATAIVWISVAVIGMITSNEFMNGAAAILALIATVTIWTLWALDYYGISVDGTGQTTRQSAELEKAKRESNLPNDDRMALLLSLLTPEERDAVRTRLIDDMRADGEIVSLADVLAEQQQDVQHTERHL